MPTDAHSGSTAPSTGALLTELESVLETEKEALKRLDHRTLAETTERKLLLCERLADSPRELAAEDRSLLERLRSSALHNQLVLVHARDTVRQVLALASGRPPGAPLGGLRLDLRG